MPEASRPPDRPVMIAAEVFRRSRYGDRHPLGIPRVSTAVDLCRAMGWLDDADYREGRPATVEQLARAHDRAYLAALIDAERDQDLDAARRARFNIGRLEAPIFPEIFTRPATAAGCALLAIELLRDGGTAYSPASGTHHGRRDRASGFCFLNDLVLAILALLDQGLDRVAYVDIDAHHGDGVEEAFSGDPRVLMISVHEAGRWPGSGLGPGEGPANAVNLPVPAGFGDSEMALLRDRVIVPALRAFAPQAIVLQGGADALADDPLSRLDLSNRAHWAVVGALRGLAPRLLVTGGGGYNPWSVGRCWAGVWATLCGLDPTVPPGPAALAVLRGLTWTRSQGRNPSDRWLTTLADAPREGPVRDAVHALAEAALGLRVAEIARAAPMP